MEIGQNGLASQNTHIQILLKQGWSGNDFPIGVTTLFTQNYSSNLKVKIKHNTINSCSLYIYLPWNYNDLTFTLNGSYSSFDLAKTVLTSEPETDKESAYYDALAKPIVAYENDSGTNGTVTLSASSASYTHIAITYRNDDGQSNTTTKSGISSAQGDFFGTIIRKNSGNTNIMINSAIFGVYGTTISISRNSQANVYFGGSTDNDPNKLYITKVELWN